MKAGKDTEESLLRGLIKSVHKQPPIVEVSEEYLVHPERDLELLREDFKCPVCGYLVYKPRECLECGLICSSCFKKRASSSMCPLAITHKSP